MTREPKRDRHPRDVPDNWNPDLVEFRLRRATARPPCPPCPTSWKRRYPSKAAAVAWGVEWKRGHPDDPAEFEPYECDCTGWHLRNAYKQQVKRELYEQRRKGRSNG